MTVRNLSPSVACSVLLALVLLPIEAMAQSNEGSPSPRTAWGAPDLTGVWDFRTRTPFERPEDLSDQSLFTAEEAAAFEADRLAAFAVRDDQEPADGVGNYNQFWLVDREFDHRTSLVVDPPSGRLPPLTAAAPQLTAARALHVAANPASSWTARRLQERCVTFGMPNLFAGYHPYYQIFQTPDHVVILHEMIHDARIIPLRDAPHIDDTIRQWHGDARGYWDGDTLVVETRNFSAQAESPAALYQRTRGSAAQLQLVERFTRVGPDTLQHEFTVNAAGTYSATWTAMIPLKRSNEPLFEYACHEGNIGMEGILSGHPAEESAGAER